MILSGYPQTEIVIGTKWIGAHQRQTLANINPATGEELGRVPCVTQDDLIEVASVAQKAFLLWKLKSALDRSAILRRFADLLRVNVEMIARNISLDEGKPVAEALAEFRRAFKVCSNKYCANQSACALLCRLGIFHSAKPCAKWSAP
jgi:succinate-semialdehyde dehydrogenase / glutarate-semialdehyde dehydrogenase